MATSLQDRQENSKTMMTTKTTIRKRFYHTYNKAKSEQETFTEDYLQFLEEIDADLVKLNKSMFILGVIVKVFLTAVIGYILYVSYDKDTGVFETDSIIFLVLLIFLLVKKF